MNHKKRFLYGNLVKNGDTSFLIRILLRAFLNPGFSSFNMTDLFYDLPKKKRATNKAVNGQKIVLL